MADEAQQSVRTNHKKDNWFKRHKILTVILALILIGIIGSAAGGSSKKTASNTDNSSQPAKASTAAAKPAAPKWDAQAAYAQIANGMTKAQVEAATGVPSKDCTQSAIAGAGNYETCSYRGNGFSDKGSIIVTYTDGAVSSKTQSQY